MEHQHYTIQTPKDKPEYRKAFLRFVILDQSFDKVFLQRKRIETAKAIPDLKVLFADIHFFLVVVTNVMEGFKDLRTVIKNDRELSTNYYNQELNAIYKKYIPQLEYLNIFRDHLEHITDGRLDGLGKNNHPLKNPGMLGNLFGDDYDFGGEKFNLIESFSMLDEFYSELRVWNKRAKIYPLWQIELDSRASK